uniref:Uncharacterized protein n=1 Tax=Ceratitis capitata TaxID=7213 RepID=W8BCX9_CERCA
MVCNKPFSGVIFKNFKALASNHLKMILQMQLLSNNMNQLFGESNDDDDDYDDNQNVDHKNYKDYHKNRVHNTDFLTTTSINSTVSARKSTNYGQKYSQSHQMQR